MKEIECCPCGIYVFDCTYHKEEAMVAWFRFVNNHMKMILKEMESIQESIEMSKKIMGWNDDQKG